MNGKYKDELTSYAEAIIQLHAPLAQGVDPFDRTISYLTSFNEELESFTKKIADKATEILEKVPHDGSVDLKLLGDDLVNTGQEAIKRFISIHRGV